MRRATICRAGAALAACLVLAGCSSPGPAATSSATSSGAGTGPKCSAVRLLPKEIDNLHFLTPTTAVGLVSTGTGLCPGRLAASTDGGRTWKPSGAPLPDAAVFGPLATMTFWSTEHGYVASSGRLEVTQDDGRTWRRALAGFYVGATASYGHSVWALASHCLPGQLGTGCGYQLLGTTDDWRHFAPVARVPSELGNYGTEQLVRMSASTGAIALGQAGPDALYVVRDHTVSSSTVCAGGQSPDRFARSPGGTVYLLCIGGTTGGAVPKSLSVSDDGGAIWTPVGTAAPNGALTTFAAPSGSTVVLVEHYGLWTSSDGGRTWSKAPGSPFGGNQTYATVSFAGPRNVWLLVPGAGLWHSGDGVHWSPV